MRVIRHVAFTTMALIAAAAPAAAQDPQWLRDLEEHIERHAEAIGRMVEAQIERVQNRQPRQDRRGPDVTGQFSRTVRLGPNGTFDLENVAGDIVVNGVGGDDVRIEATRRVRAGSDAAARAALEDLQVQVAERGGNVEVRTVYPRRRGTSAVVDYTVSVPNSANVTLKTVSGSVRVSNVRGEVRAESVSGDITATSIERVRNLKSVSGTLQITDAEGTDLEGATVSGDVIARNLKMRTIAVKSVSGGLRFTDVESERATLSSVSGDIEFSGRLARSGRYELESHSGDLRVTPGGDTGFDVEANTFSGNLRSDYDLNIRAGTALGFRSGGNRTIRGTVGAAGAALVLRSFSGDVTIIRP
jgi:DUF4097 and DUF4098 domain-containing protein YvlB